MITRRTFVQGSIAAAGLVGASPALFASPPTSAAAGGGGGSLRLHAVLFEARHAHSVAFADVAAGLGLRMVEAGNDITPAWLEIVGQWRKEPVPVAGLTTWTPLMLLGQSARDHGLRLLFRGVHRQAGSGQIGHSLQGPRRVVGAFEGGIGAGVDYAGSLAHAFARCPGGDAGGAANLESMTATGGADAPATLHSWIIGPRGRVTGRGATA